MKVLVTGGAGFIGSHLVDRLIGEGLNVSVIDNLSTGKREYLNNQANFYEADIVKREAVEKIMREVQPDFVFHLAALPRVPISVADPVSTSEVNILGTLHVFQAAVRARVRRVVFASSSSVYGNQRTLPLREDMLASPVSPYGLQKLTGERFASMFSELYHLPVVSLRYFNIYGPRMDWDYEYGLVIGKFLRQRRDGKPLTIFGDGEQTRSFCYIDDAVEATLLAAFSENIKGGEVINIGGSRAHSVNELARVIGGFVVHLAPRPGDIRHAQADLTLARELLDWRPKTRFEEGIQKTKEWFQSTVEES